MLKNSSNEKMLENMLSTIFLRAYLVLLSLKEMHLLVLVLYENFQEFLFFYFDFLHIFDCNMKYYLYLIQFLLFLLLNLIQTL